MQTQRGQQSDNELLFMYHICSIYTHDKIEIVNECIFSQGRPGKILSSQLECVIARQCLVSQSKKASLHNDRYKPKTMLSF